jgi:hypothetical protein
MGDEKLPEPVLHQFSVTTTRGPSQDDVVTLLYRVADALDELGGVDVVDITYQVEETDDGWQPSMTVYYEVDDEDVPVEDTPGDTRTIVDVAAAEAEAEAVRDDARAVLVTGSETHLDAPVAVHAAGRAGAPDDVLPHHSAIWNAPTLHTATPRPATAPPFPPRLDTSSEPPTALQRLKELLRSNRRRDDLH